VQPIKDWRTTTNASDLIGATAFALIAIGTS
jgi:hypothetical protein